MKKITNTVRGFTLIELLVVIAIIGILSSVVLVSLNTARSKGTDAKIEATLGGIRSGAEIEYSNNNNSYSTVFSGATNQPYLTSLAGMTSYRYAASSTGYAISAPLVGNTGNDWCIDSNGNAGIISSISATTSIQDAAGCK